MSILDRFRLTKPTLPAEGAGTAPAAKEVGRSGTVNNRGWIRELESNDEWRWPRNMDVIELMRRTDPTVKWMLLMSKVPILAANFYVDPASPADEDVEAAAFVQHAIFEELDGGFKKLLRRILSYLDFGHSVFNRVAELRDVEFEYTPKKAKPEDDDPEPVTVTRKAFVIGRMAPRLQRTIREWNAVEGDSSQLANVVQYLGDGLSPNEVTIDARDLVVFTNEQEGDDWRGVSLLRTAWRDWRYKVDLENLEAIGLERSTGLPVAYPPSNATPEQLDSIERSISDLKQGESVYIVMPGPKAGTNVDEAVGWLLEDLAITGDGQADPDKAIQRHESGMARNVLAEFMKLGQQGEGARAVGDVQQGPYYQAVQAIVEYICEMLTKELAAPLVAWNYDVSRVPKVKASKIEANNIALIADVLQKLIAQGAITVDSELEAHLRDVLELPDKPLEEPEEEIPPGMVKTAKGDVVPDPALVPPQVQPVPAGDPTDPRVQPAKPPGDRTKKLSEFDPGRELTKHEKVLALTEIVTLLDNGQSDLIEKVQHAGHDAVRDTEQAVATAVAARTPEAISAVSVPTYEIEDEIRKVLFRVYEGGQEQVRAELRKQLGSVKLADRTSLMRSLAKDSVQRILNAVARSAAESIANAATRAIRQRALRTMQDGSVPTGAGYDPFAAMRAEAKGAAAGIISAAFNLGRNDEQLARSGEISHSVYTSVLDKTTCEPCLQADGTVGPPGGLPELPCPNPDCAGGGQCKCMWIPVAG
jgi:hypothetical protein